MKVKPKEIMVNLPVVLTFATEDEIAALASGVNTFIHGKVRVKYEVLGTLGGQYIGLFYLQRNNESQQLHDEFMRMIDQEEMGYDPIFDNNLSEERHEVYETKHKSAKKNQEDPAELRARGILINDDGVYCRQVPECGCGLCWNQYGGYKP